MFLDSCCSGNLLNHQTLANFQFNRNSGVKTYQTASGSVQTLFTAHVNVGVEMRNSSKNVLIKFDILQEGPNILGLPGWGDIGLKSVPRMHTESCIYEDFRLHRAKNQFCCIEFHPTIENTFFTTFQFNPKYDEFPTVLISQSDELDDIEEALGFKNVLPPEEDSQKVNLSQKQLFSLHKIWSHCNYRELFKRIGLSKKFAAKSSACQKATEACVGCQKARNKGIPPKVSGRLISFPLQQLNIDLVDVPFHGKLFSVCACVDYFSKFNILRKMEDKSSAQVFKTLEFIIKNYAKPQRIVMDGGPEFKAEFYSKLKEMLIKATVPPPYSPFKNGAIEIQNKWTVAVAKKLEEKFGPQTPFEDVISAIQKVRNSAFHIIDGKISCPQLRFLGLVDQISEISTHGLDKVLEGSCEYEEFLEDVRRAHLNTISDKAIQGSLLNSLKKTKELEVGKIVVFRNDNFTSPKTEKKAKFGRLISNDGRVCCIDHKGSQVRVNILHVWPWIDSNLDEYEFEDFVDDESPFDDKRPSPNDNVLPIPTPINSPFDLKIPAENSPTLDNNSCIPNSPNKSDNATSSNPNCSLPIQKSVSQSKDLSVQHQKSVIQSKDLSVQHPTYRNESLLDPLKTSFPSDHMALVNHIQNEIDKNFDLILKDAWRNTGAFHNSKIISNFAISLPDNINYYTSFSGWRPNTMAIKSEVTSTTNIYYTILVKRSKSAIVVYDVNIRSKDREEKWLVQDLDELFDSISKEINGIIFLCAYEEKISLFNENIFTSITKSTLSSQSFNPDCAHPLNKKYLPLVKDKYVCKNMELLKQSKSYEKIFMRNADIICVTKVLGGTKMKVLSNRILNRVSSKKEDFNARITIMYEDGEVVAIWCDAIDPFDAWNTSRIPYLIKTSFMLTIFAKLPTIDAILLCDETSQNFSFFSCDFSPTDNPTLHPCEFLFKTQGVTNSNKPRPINAMEHRANLEKFTETDDLEFKKLMDEKTMVLVKTEKEVMKTAIHCVFIRSWKITSELKTVPKSRLVPLGHLDAGKNKYRSDASTPRPTLLLNFISELSKYAKEFGASESSVFFEDVSNAYVQSKLYPTDNSRSIYLILPARYRTKNCIHKLLRPIYGISESGRLWQSDAAIEMFNVGFQRFYADTCIWRFLSPLARLKPTSEDILKDTFSLEDVENSQPNLTILTKTNADEFVEKNFTQTFNDSSKRCVQAISLVHTDDFLNGDPLDKFGPMRKAFKFKSKETLSSKKNIKHLGLIWLKTMVGKLHGIKISIKAYVVGIPPIEIPSGEIQEHDFTNFRSLTNAIGHIQNYAVSFKFTLHIVRTKQNNPSIEDFEMINQFLADLKASILELNFVFIENPKIFTFCDAACAGKLSNESNTRGYVSFVCEKEPVHETARYYEYLGNLTLSHCGKITYPSKFSSFSTEACALLDAMTSTHCQSTELIRFLRFSSQPIDHEILSDNLSLIRSVYKITPCDETEIVSTLRSIMDSHASDVATLKEARVFAQISSYKHYYPISIRYVSGHHNYSNELTKIVPCRDSLIESFQSNNRIRIYKEDIDIFTPLPGI